MKSIFSKYKSLVLIPAFIFISVLSATELDAQTRRKVEVGEFHTISLNSNYKLILRQSNTQEVEAKVDAEIWDATTVWVDNGVLHIDMKTEDPSKKSVLEKLENIKLQSQMEIYITFKSLKKIIVNSAGKVTSENSINSPNFEIEVNGTGSVNIDVKATTVKAALYSDGNLTMSGYSTNLQLTAAGEGEVNMLNFDAKIAKVDVRGMDTKCQISVSQSLDIVVYGNAEVFYKGNTSDVKKLIYGAGKVLKRS